MNNYLDGSGARSGAAIVTTFRAADAYLRGFVRYHLATGFDRLYLFQDDPSERIPDELIADSRVCVVPHDATLQACWRMTLDRHVKLPLLYEWRDREVMARQLLNVAVAIDLARRDDMRWLLSIDVDELFFCGERMSVRSHFESLERRGILHSVYFNHELVPERWNAGDPFAESSLFKLSPHVLGADRRNWFGKRFPGRFDYFNYYHWGKAAARLVDGLLPGFTVHEFLLPGHAEPAVRHANPCILHYAICGFAEFAKKYAVLGQFGDRWFGTGVDIRQALPFHAAARDAVADRDPQAAARFYRDNVLFTCGEIEELLRQGLCRRFAVPSSLSGHAFTSA
ncbi:glycosyltransferase family 2 protein [Burkholderia ubonensis]|uniref:Glycosyl transferase family 2 n=1 Tax=Burkholderia ubonensis TaxID=101571 RepID=A0AAW3MT40_9BURK|nr:glycosyltransferase family 2 protein [Burkholderia ubonensis]KVP94106.1 hypothetical protein WJ96_13190 [Burkholderia ubonensis]KVX25326.1 hypothetical protein WL02_31115 [Burkholderia ubonensis]